MSEIGVNQKEIPMSLTSLRKHWHTLATRLAQPILSALSKDQLRTTMPVETVCEQVHRKDVTHLEAVARMLAGLSPWLQNDPQASDLAQIVPQALRVGLDPQSHDHLNFNQGAQPLVDAAFLAQAILRAPDLLWNQLDSTTQQRLIHAMISSRTIKPAYCNWLLFSAMIETFLAWADQPYDAMRIDYALRQFEQWYKGDSIYGDGPAFHWDYYNSFVIYPMMLDITREMSKHRDDWLDITASITTRAKRHAIIQERLIAPDGSFPAIGRSLCYRCGAFYHLAYLASREELPDTLPPAQVRTALNAVIDRTLLAPDTFDENGWLTLGLAGHQPNLAERYISTGSLYLCSTALLPLGLASTSSFWADQTINYTSQIIWSGINQVQTDHAQ
jgi:hypothetical protein